SPRRAPAAAPAAGRPTATGARARRGRRWSGGRCAGVRPEAINLCDLAYSRLDIAPDGRGPATLQPCCAPGRLRSESQGGNTMTDIATQPRRLENLQTDKGKFPVYANGVVEQPWDTYAATDHDVWRRLYARQRELLVGRASEAFLQAQDAMGMTLDAIPRFSDINQVLSAATGWTLIGVEGLLPELDFFDHLANRRFPVTWWIRKPGQFDYIEEPDLFHDLFGHVPLLMNPVFADYMEAY